MPAQLRDQARHSTPDHLSLARGTVDDTWNERAETLKAELAAQREDLRSLSTVQSRLDEQLEACTELGQTIISENFVRNEVMLNAATGLRQTVVSEPVMAMSQDPRMAMHQEPTARQEPITQQEPINPVY